MAADFSSALSERGELVGPVNSLLGWSVYHGLVIDLATGIIVTVAFLVALFVVPAWLTGLIPGKGTDKMAPSDFSDQPEGAAGNTPQIESNHGKHTQIER